MSNVRRLGDGVYRLGDMVVYRVISWSVRRGDLHHRRQKAKEVAWHVDRMRAMLSDEHIQELLHGNLHRRTRNYIDAFETYREAMEFAGQEVTR